MSETNEQRWQQQADLAETYRKEAEHWQQQAKQAGATTAMLQECLQAMMETTGRAVIRVEFRINKEDNMYVVASSSKDHLEHLARLVGNSYAGFLEAAKEVKG